MGVEHTGIVDSIGCISDVCYGYDEPLLKAPALVFVAHLACTLDRVFIAQNKTTPTIQLI